MKPIFHFKPICHIVKILNYFKLKNIEEELVEKMLEDYNPELVEKTNLSEIKV